jgi:hypothetical protein
VDVAGRAGSMPLVSRFVLDQIADGKADGQNQRAFLHAKIWFVSQFCCFFFRFFMFFPCICVSAAQ